jgi:hypothetical protein
VHYFKVYFSENIVRTYGPYCSQAEAVDAAAPIAALGFRVVFWAQ